MQTVRRLYVYLLSGVTLGFLIYGLIALLEVLLGQLGIGRGTLVGGEGGDVTRQQLSVAAALIGVGLPVWAFHWWLAERSLQQERAGAEDERGSTLRALYLTMVLVVLLGFGVFAARDLVNQVVLAILPRVPEGYYFGSNPAASLATLLVAAAWWGYHVAIRRRDMARGPLEGGAAWLPRVYVYGATLVALFLALQALGELVAYGGEAAWPPGTAPEVDDYRSVALASSVATLGVWAVAWLGHWWYAGRLMAATGWRARSERGASLRTVFFVAVIVAAAFSVLRLVSDAAAAILVPIFGAADAIGGNRTGTDLVRAVAVSLATAVPWALAWWLHRRRMHAEALEAEDSQRSATAMRLDLHAVALVGLAFAALGIGWLIGLMLDVLLGGSRTLGGFGFWRAELARYLPFAVLGLGVWLWRWWPIQARHAADPAGEASSTVRRAFLLLILAATVITSLGSLALVLYRLFGSLLGAELGGNAVAELSGPIGALVVAAAIALYHGLALRQDLALRAAAAPSPAAAPAPAAAPTEPTEVGRAFVLHGPPDGDIDAALRRLRDVLPEGYRLDEG